MSERNNAPPEQLDLYCIRHTAAHILAQAVTELYPEAKLAIGPPIENGFYYDFDLGVDAAGNRRAFKPDDLPQLEKRVRQIIAGNHALVYRELSVAEAQHLFQNQPYKLELIAELAQAGEVISTYRQDSFEDLCRGPHAAHTGQIAPDAVRLMSIAGAYWRGDKSQPMLQRIYGTAWHNKQELRQHLQLLEEARQRDHRKLGRDLEIFIIDEEIGPGLPLWLPNGHILREELEKLAREMEDAAGYARVSTPHIAKEALYRRSGHLPYYEDEMYAPMNREGATYYLRPMNCPFHHKIFASKPRSYRDLPLRLSEYGTVYRYEQSGSLFGLLRVRGQTQNDAHIYCAESQLASEFIAVMDLYRRYFDLFGIKKYVMRLSKHSRAGLGKKYVDDEPMWLKMEALIRQVMLSEHIPFVEAADEAAFYGPKIDVQVWSAIGREFSLATNQVDFVQPPRFDLTFTNQHGNPETPLCIHRAPLGSHERFIGFLIEHYAGHFPVWLAPEQVRVIPITDAHQAYAAQLAAHLRQAGIRAQAMMSSERMSAKVRQAQHMKVPYMVIVGDQEMAEETISVRERHDRQQSGVSLAAFIEHVRQVIDGREPEL